MPEMKFYIMYNNTPLVDGETWKVIQFNSFEDANTIFATLPEDMQEDGEIKNIILFYDDGYAEFGYDYNTVIENDVLSIYVEDDKYKIYDSDGNYFNYLGEMSEDFSKQVRKIIDILEVFEKAYGDIPFDLSTTTKTEEKIDLDDISGSATDNM